MLSSATPQKPTKQGMALMRFSKDTVKSWSVFWEQFCRVHWYAKEKLSDQGDSHCFEYSSVALFEGWKDDSGKSS